VPWTGANSTDWTRYDRKIDHTKVSGSANLTNFPVLIKDGNLSDAVYGGLQSGLYQSSLYSDVNLVSYYRFNTGALTTDSKGANTLTGINTPTETTGKFSGAAALASASSQAFSVVDDVSLRPTGAFTISAWIKTSTGNASQSIFQTYSQNTNVAGIQLRVNSDGTNVKLYLISGKNTGTAGTDYKEITGGTNLNNGLWHHVVGVWDTTNLRLYVDGVSDATAVAWANAPAYAATNYIRVGSLVNSGSGSLFFNGSIDDLSIFSRALSATEIAQIYSSQNGQDLRITTDSTGAVEVPFEIVSMDTTAKTCEIWAKIPTVSYTVDTNLYIWYANANAIAYDANAPFGSQAVWSGYLLSQHLQNNSLDSTVNDYDGIDTSITYVDGKIGKSASFNATGDKIELANSSILSFERTSSFSIKGWIYISSINVNRFFVSKMVNGGNYNGYAVWQDGSSNAIKVELIRATGVTGIVVITSSAFTTLNTWTKLLITYDGSSSASGVKIYLNGQLQSLTTFADDLNATMVSSVAMQIGNRGGSFNLDGGLDDIGIIGSVVSVDWEATEYANQNSPSTFVIASSNIKSIAGVPYASIKKINGLAIASIKKVAGLA
jgi:hypothetical protein